MTKAIEGALYVTADMDSDFALGEVVRLKEDDGSECPYFESISTGNRCYDMLYYFNLLNTTGLAEALEKQRHFYETGLEIKPGEYYTATDVYSENCVIKVDSFEDDSINYHRVAVGRPTMPQKVNQPFLSRFKSLREATSEEIAFFDNMTAVYTYLDSVENPVF